VKAREREYRTEIERGTETEGLGEGRTFSSASAASNSVMRALFVARSCHHQTTNHTITIITVTNQPTITTDSWQVICCQVLRARERSYRTAPSPTNHQHPHCVVARFCAQPHHRRPTSHIATVTNRPHHHFTATSCNHNTTTPLD